LTAGRIVHYVLSNGEHRAAMVTKAPPMGKEEVNLLLFPDDGDLGNLTIRPSLDDLRNVPHDEKRVPGTWHWPALEHDYDVDRAPRRVTCTGSA
jgi:hypothetical protein